jgi:hypothetical protein
VRWERMRSSHASNQSQRRSSQPQARPQPDGGWDLRCLVPLVGEFRLRSGNVLHSWSEELGEWLPASEMDLAEVAVAEAEEMGN